jgi:hypothetical protein
MEQSMCHICATRNTRTWHGPSARFQRRQRKLLPNARRFCTLLRTPADIDIRDFLEAEASNRDSATLRLKCIANCNLQGNGV